MLRIEQDTTVEGGAAFRLEGQIAGPWVEALRATCFAAFARGTTPLRLDLAGVTFIDPEGLELLGNLWDRVVVIRSSLFAAEQLKRLGERSGKDSELP